MRVVVIVIVVVVVWPTAHSLAGSLRRLLAVLRELLSAPEQLVEEAHRLSCRRGTETGVSEMGAKKARSGEPEGLPDLTRKTLNQ
jgi:hypothetical protein